MKHPQAIQLAILSITLVAFSAISVPAQEVVLPKPEPPFQGKIGRTVKDSTPDFPKSIEAPAGAPNVLLIMTDDVGFGASSTFGGPIQTPNFQRIADSGLRYNMFHTTALCSPLVTLAITRSFPKVLVLWERSSRKTASTLHGLAKCTTCRTGCPVRPVHSICGRVA